jgi:glycerol 2-dehydrogenase (NADP+)
MSTGVPAFTLNNGQKMPAVGLGCCPYFECRWVIFSYLLGTSRCWMGFRGGGERVYEMCKTALSLGYRHLDTAAGYGVFANFQAAKPRLNFL